MISKESSNPKSRKALNRAALICRPKEPFIKWLKSLTYEWKGMSLDRLRGDDSGVYLIDELSDEELQEKEKIIDKYWASIVELYCWSYREDEDPLPPIHNRETFQEWFDIEWHSCVTDLCVVPIVATDPPIDW